MQIEKNENEVISLGTTEFDLLFNYITPCFFSQISMLQKCEE